MLSQSAPIIGIIDSLRDPTSTYITMTIIYLGITFFVAYITSLVAQYSLRVSGGVLACCGAGDDGMYQ